MLIGTFMGRNKTEKVQVGVNCIPDAELTAGALTQAVYRGTAGQSPKKPGPKQDEQKQALVASVQAYTRACSSSRASLSSRKQGSV